MKYVTGWDYSLPITLNPRPIHDYKNGASLDCDFWVWIEKMVLFYLLLGFWPQCKKSVGKQQTSQFSPALQ